MPIAWPPDGSQYAVLVKIVTMNRQGLLMDILVGIVGGILGGWLWGLLGFSDDSPFFGVDHSQGGDDGR